MKQGDKKYKLTPQLVARHKTGEDYNPLQFRETLCANTVMEALRDVCIKK